MSIGKRAIYAQIKRAKGLCTQCSKPTSGHCYCETCRVKNLERLAKKRNGQLWQAGKPGRPPKGKNGKTLLAQYLQCAP